jgi:hypothetical protein
MKLECWSRTCEREYVTSYLASPPVVAQMRVQYVEELAQTEVLAVPSTQEIHMADRQYDAIVAEVFQADIERLVLGQEAAADADAGVDADADVDVDVDVDVQMDSSAHSSKLAMAKSYKAAPLARLVIDTLALGVVAPETLRVGISQLRF